MAKKQGPNRREIEASLELMAADRIIQVLDQAVREKGATTTSLSAASQSPAAKFAKDAARKDNISGFGFILGGLIVIDVGVSLHHRILPDTSAFPVLSEDPASTLISSFGLMTAAYGGSRLFGNPSQWKVWEKVGRIDSELTSRTNWFLGHHGLPSSESNDWASVSTEQLEDALDAAEASRTSAAQRLSNPDSRPLDMRTAYGIAAEIVMNVEAPLSKGPSLI